MESLAQLFYDEANEMMEQMEQILLNLEENGADPEVVNALFRYAHSLKGNSGAMGFTQINKFTHGLESALDHVRKGSKQLTAEMCDYFLKGVDVLRSLLEASRTEGDVGSPACKEILDGLTMAMSKDAATVGAKPQETATETNSATAEPAVVVEEPAVENDNSTKLNRYSVTYTPAPTLDQDNDPIKNLNELKEYAAISNVKLVEQIPPLSDLLSDSCYCVWEFEVETQFESTIIRAVLELACEGSNVDITDLNVKSEISEEEKPVAKAEEPVKTAAQAKEAKPQANEQVNAITQQVQARKSAESQTIRVSTEKVDDLFNLTSEIVIAQSMLMNSSNRIVDTDIRTAISTMERHVRELHERVMAIRMIPVGYVFSRFPRLVRDLASSCGKDIHLEIYGEETELDRTLLESLTDPLTHLLRNSVDHGIESPEVRESNNKSKTGTVKLGAFQSEGRIFIEVSDDGKGIDLERVRQKAIALEWIREDEIVSQETLFDFIMKPGFSTAEKVSDVSGRGVGMDVVRRNVEALGGIVSIQSEPGKGSKIFIKVPLTLAIMDGLNLRVGDDFFIIPLTSVIETHRPDAVTLCSAFDQHEMLSVRGKILPIIKLSSIFGVRNACAKTNDGLLVIVEQDEQQVALFVDEIVGQHQVVMKSLEANFERVPGFSGATILGDGHVALILDVGDIIRRAGMSAVAQVGVESAEAVVA